MIEKNEGVPKNDSRGKLPTSKNAGRVAFEGQQLNLVTCHPQPDSAAAIFKRRVLGVAQSAVAVQRENFAGLRKFDLLFGHGQRRNAGTGSRNLFGVRPPKKATVKAPVASYPMACPCWHL